MRILIHAVPERLWYVENFLMPSLIKQGAEDVRIWCDENHSGNLKACMDAFACMEGDKGTWHLQDDVIVCRDFVTRCRELDIGVVYGFCCRNFGDRLDAFGTVYPADAWNSFQCVRIPDEYARECAAWVRSEEWRSESMENDLNTLWEFGRGDDTFFHEFMKARHTFDAVENVAPNLVEHVDCLLGGSTLQTWRDYIARSEFWDDQELVKDLKTRINRRKVL